MRTKTTLILMAAAMLLAGTCFGRLGESVQECDNRYGKPEDIAPAEKTVIKLPQRSYLFNGYRVIVMFMSGKSCNERFIKIEPDENGERAISEDDKLMIRLANLQITKRQINQGKYVEGVEEWVDNQGNRAFLTWNNKYPCIDLSTKDYLEYNRKFFEDQKRDAVEKKECEDAERLRKF